MVKEATRHLVYRVDQVDQGDMCEGKASHVFVGLDANDNALLDGREAQPNPMTFCRIEPAEIEIVDSPPNAYCPRPGRVLMIRFKGDPPERHAELVVCFSPSGEEIESTYAVYGPR